MSTKQSLHWVFKIGDRKRSLDFFKNVLQMNVLRHEEFKEGCDAACNGPYDGKWSKTMIGYGPEDKHFVLELTYNYGISAYSAGNEFLGIHINSKEIFKKVTEESDNITKECIKILSPDNYAFYIYNKDCVCDPIQGVSLATTNIEKTKKFWNEILGMKILTQNDNEMKLSYDRTQSFVHFVKSETIDRAEAYGRIAFSIPIVELKPLETKAKEAGYVILTPFITLETPGKADVSVVIFADPDGHEICFVGEEGFKDLSQVDPRSDQLLNEAIDADKSDEWFAKKGKTKATK